LCSSAGATLARPSASRDSMWRRAPCLEISRCAATSPRDACPRVLMKARMVSRLESTNPYYEFFNILVEIHLAAERTLRAMRRTIAALIVAGLALAPMTVHADGVAWQQWRPIPGVFDIVGPRNGFLVVAGSAALYLVHPEGEVAAFARGTGGYHDDPGTEAYLAVSTGGHVNASDCAFAPDETFILRVHSPLGVT